MADGLALCSLHHALLDLCVLGLTTDLRIRVYSLDVARSDAGRRAVDDLSAQALLAPGVSLSWSWITSAGITGRTSRQLTRRLRRTVIPSAYRGQDGKSASEINQAGTALDSIHDSDPALLLASKPARCRH